MNNGHEVDAYDELIAFVRLRPSQKQAAKDLGVSVGYMNDLIHKHRDISNEVAERLGLTRRIVFYKKTNTRGGL